MQISKYFRFSALAILALTCLATLLPAAEYKGTVKYGGLPLPGATITATQGDKKLIAMTDPQGAYSFPEMADGAWNIQVEMLCFETVKQDVTLAAGAPAGDWNLKLLPFDQIKASAVEAPPPPPPTATTSVTPQLTPAQIAANEKAVKPSDSKKNAKNGPPPAPANAPGGFQRTQANATATAPTADAAPAAPASESLAGRSAADASDGFLVNGSTNNSASSPFALAGAFGNSRRGGRSLYNGNIGIIIDNSAFDARPYSQTGQDTERPPYNKMTGVFAFGGPLKIPHLLKNGPNVFVTYQGVRNSNAGIASSLMPTIAERNGDFSQVLGPNGQPVQLIDPYTGRPIASNNISDRISPQAKALLPYFPLPNFTGSTQFNYQIPIISNQHVDSLQGRWNKGIGRKNQLNGGVGFSSNRSDNPNSSGFFFLDTASSFGIQTNISWRHSFTNRFSGTAGYTFSRQSSTSVPFFANRTNVSGTAGITGNNQEPQNWGPPSLSFASVTGLRDGNSSVFHNQTHAVSYAMQWNRGRHNVSFGADYKRQQFNTDAQSNPRGTFQFNGQAAGNDFAGFLMGVPDSSAIAFGNADKYLRSTLYDAFINDDWRISPGFTLNFGMRWEYNSPVTEIYGRLVNLDITKGYQAIAPVVANSPTGSLTGQSYPDSLVKPDKTAFQPRLAISWRPLPASSLVVRAGYGTYYNTSVYQTIANQMAQQAPLSKSFNIANSLANPLTLANGFTPPAGTVLNTFAIDPNFRVGYTHTWQVSVQRDLPQALIMTATYLGIKGTRGTQEFLPNTYPAGALNPCPICPSGFAFLASNGNSTREAGQFNLRRRLHNGFQASVNYTFAKAFDDAALGGNGGGGAVIAQNWLDLSAERGLSSFDQRHLVTLTGQYTSGMGIRGGTLMGGWRGVALKEWTIVTTVNAGSGLPLTPLYSAIVTGTGVTGPIRPDYTGADLYDAKPGLFLNPLAYTKPQSGQWGNAGRNSITGPSQFSLDASMGRTFRATDRISVDFRVDLKNAFNHVVFGSYNTNISSLQFGVPVSPNQMRTASTTIRARF
jgi:trimeric autotransporter adhesin